MYPSPFHYHRAANLAEAATLLAQLGEEARLLAGGQSLIPLMKLRLAAPSHLVDLNFIPELDYLQEEGADLRFGPLARHAQIAHSPLAAAIPILHDCAAGIADSQVRWRGTMAGSIAEADPSGDWAPALMTLDTRVLTVSPRGERSFALPEFVLDAYTTELEADEVIREIVVARPPAKSGGAYVAFKRSAQVYASASAAVRIDLEDGDVCGRARVLLGCVGLTPVRAVEAEDELAGKPIDESLIRRAAEAAQAAADPQPDRRGSAEYKRVLTGALVRKAADAALRRARGERVEMSHEYA